MTNGTTTIDYEYNADGIRTKKTVTTASNHTHIFQSTIIAPTCTENGHTLHVCSCGYIYQDTPVAATGHTFTTTVVATSCTEIGYTLYECECGYSYQEGSSGHTFTTLVVEPTETVNGFTRHTCACGYSYESDPVASLGSTEGTDEEGVSDVKEYEYVYNGSSLTQLTITISEYGESPVVETLYFAYDGSSPMAVTYNGATYYYVTNLQGDVIAILDDEGNTVVEYAYDAWGNILNIGGSDKDTLGVANPLTYRGYVYDTETGLYYVSSRYYDPEIGRFINADAFPSTGQGIIGNNMFAYCGNNPVARVDIGGYFWDTVFDVVSLCFSIVDVASNPTDVTAWIGLAGDAIDLIPFVSGVGELTRAATTTLEVIDSVHDTSRLIDNTGDIIDTAGDVARKTDFYITPNGEAIPATLDGFNDNLSKLDYQNGKYVGADSNGPIRIRTNEIHPSDPNFTGVPNPLHTVPHFHIDRRANGLTGKWGKTFTGPMEMFY